MNHERQYFETSSTTTSRTASTASSSTSSSSSSSRYTEPGVSQNLLALKEGYNAVLGAMGAPVAWYLERLMAEGMQVEVILNAIQETAWARRPSPQYMRAILERYRVRGIKNMTQLLHDQQEFEDAKQWFED